MHKGEFKKQKNLLRDFILKSSSKEYSKQTISGLFRSILEPLTEFPNQEGLVLYKLNDADGVESILKRLSFSSITMHTFSDIDLNKAVKNIQKEDCWDSVEFVLVLARRYSAVLIWDYSLSIADNFSQICLIYNSRSVGDAARAIFENSKIELDEFLTNFAPDRRENELLNVAINKLVGCLNTVNEEIVVTEAEKETLSKTEDLLKEYEYSSEKAKLIAHEIKNHLSIIDLYAKITEKRLVHVTSDEETEKSINNALKSIKYSTYSITQFINELKTFAKPILVERKLSPILDDVIALTSPKAKENNVTLTYHVKKEARVHVDEIKIQSVLINVVYNAIEAIEDNGSISIDCSEVVDNFARVVVTDNGSGIPTDKQDKIFDKGFTTKLAGNGLGLHICKNLMKEQYGDITLLKSDENGTKIAVLVPII